MLQINTLNSYYLVIQILQLYRKIYEDTIELLIDADCNVYEDNITVVGYKGG